MRLGSTLLINEFCSRIDVISSSLYGITHFVRWKKWNWMVGKTGDKQEEKCKTKWLTANHLLRDLTIFKSLHFNLNICTLLSKSSFDTKMPFSYFYPTYSEMNFSTILILRGTNFSPSPFRALKYSVCVCQNSSKIIANFILELSDGSVLYTISIASWNEIWADQEKYYIRVHALNDRNFKPYVMVMDYYATIKSKI